jgi:hypothetical protein
MPATKSLFDLKVTTIDGRTINISDSRQKSHVVLIYEPSEMKKTVEHWQAAVNADRSQWEWLQVQIFLIKKAPAEFEPGAYAIDRYGELIHRFPSRHWTFADIEKEFIYYEASHC